jgi:hypothetical protein
VIIYRADLIYKCGTGKKAKLHATLSFSLSVPFTTVFASLRLYLQHFPFFVAYDWVK